MTKIKIIFNLFGDTFDMEQCNKIIGLQATKIREKEKEGEHKVIYKETSWSYTLTTNQYELELLSNKLINLFDKKKYDILEFKNKNNLTVKVDIIFFIENEIVPSLFLNKDFLSFLNFFESEVDIDGYI